LYLSADDDEFVTASNYKADRYFIMEWTYTAVFYTFSCFVFYHLIYTENILKPYLDDLTLDNINYVLMTSLSVLIVLLNPLLASRAREKREEYFKLWRKYQVYIILYNILHIIYTINHDSYIYLCRPSFLPAIGKLRPHFYKKLKITTYYN